MKAHVRWRRIGRYDDPIGWVRRVAINQVRDEHRRARPQAQGAGAPRGAHADLRAAGRARRVRSAPRRTPPTAADRDRAVLRRRHVRRRDRGRPRPRRGHGEVAPARRPSAAAIGARRRTRIGPGTMSEFDDRELRRCTATQSRRGDRRIRARGRPIGGGRPGRAGAPPARCRRRRRGDGRADRGGGVRDRPRHRLGRDDTGRPDGRVAVELRSTRGRRDHARVDRPRPDRHRSDVTVTTPPDHHVAGPGHHGAVGGSAHRHRAVDDRTSRPRRRPVPAAGTRCRPTDVGTHADDALCHVRARQPFTETYSSTGGSITVRWDGTALSLQSTDTGSRVRPRGGGRPADRIRVRFRGDDGDFRIEIRVEDGQIVRVE